MAASNIRVAVGSTVTGRLIVARIGRGKSKEWLYLFTTLDLPAEEIVQLYARRWNIETDLRSLKRTVRLHHIHAKSDDMLEKELLIAMAAYNFVRAVMCMAARRSRYRSPSTQLCRGPQRSQLCVAQAHRCAHQASP